MKAQDTFSILAFDSITGQVGAAGASCVDLFQFPGYNNDFIAELFPGDGAIATQASYLQANQMNARNRMAAGDSPTQLIDWLKLNDAGGDPSVRQYGVLRMGYGYPRAAAHTGTNCMNYKNHRVGPNYTIHGNILLGSSVLDSMEARFLREPGDLACKLMSALQGANVIGADTRCAPNGSSSLFAFIKVSEPTDDFGIPSFLYSLKTANGAGIEPIDSLQKLFNAAHSCLVDLTGTSEIKLSQSEILIYPSPVKDFLKIKIKSLLKPNYISIRTILGQEIMSEDFVDDKVINTEIWAKGLYLIEFKGEGESLFKKFVVN